MSKLSLVHNNLNEFTRSRIHHLITCRDLERLESVSDNFRSPTSSQHPFPDLGPTGHKIDVSRKYVTSYYTTSWNRLPWPQVGPIWANLGQVAMFCVACAIAWPKGVKFAQVESWIALIYVFSVWNTIVPKPWDHRNGMEWAYSIYSWWCEFLSHCLSRGLELLSQRESAWNHYIDIGSYIHGQPAGSKSSNSSFGWSCWRVVRPRDLEATCPISSKLASTIDP